MYPVCTFYELVVVKYVLDGGFEHILLTSYYTPRTLYTVYSSVKSSRSEKVPIERTAFSNADPMRPVPHPQPQLGQMRVLNQV